MVRMKFVTPIIALGALALSACTALNAFNTLTPKDPASLVGQGIAYGANPRQRLDVYAPKGAVKDAPVLVFFYGGGWSDGRRQDYRFAAQALASRGFVTIVPDYRLYPEVRYPLFLEDGALAVRWARDNAGRFGGDPNRLVLAGHSAGAYNAVELALDRAFLNAAGVDPKIVRGVAGLAGPYDFLPLDVDFHQEHLRPVPRPGGDPAGQSRPRRRPADVPGPRNQGHGGGPVPH